MRIVEDTTDSTFGKQYRASVIPGTTRFLKRTVYWVLIESRWHPFGWEHRRKFGRFKTREAAEEWGNKWLDKVEALNETGDYV